MKQSATNQTTGERRAFNVTMLALERATFDGVDRCTGPCKCRIEPDGHCPNGWPSRLLATGII